MTPRSISLRGLSLAEAEAKVRKFIDDIQEEILENSEITLIDLGANPDELAAELAHHRAELEKCRETAIKRMRIMVVCGGGETLN